MRMTDNFTTLALGTSRMASMGSKISQNEADLLFSIALENNIRTIDTSDTYGSGDSERMIGKAIKSNRKDYFIITKAGFPYMALPGFLSPLNQVGKKILQKISSEKSYKKDYLIKSLHKSLKRLKTDSVDCFMLHEPAANELLNSPDCWGALTEIKSKGMSKSIGISTNDSAALILALNNVPIDFVQTSMQYTSSISPSVFDICKTGKIPIIVNQVLFPLKRLIGNESLKKVLKNNLKSEKDLIPILIAYATFSKKADCVLVGTKNPSHLKENTRYEDFSQNMDEIFLEISNLLS